jgi:hypothetical protein
MIEDKKRKTRRVSKKVKKMHEEVVSKGILGATPPEGQKGGGGPYDVYKIDMKKGGEVVSSELKDYIQTRFISLDDLLKKVESGHTIRIEKSDRIGREPVRIYRFEEI